MSLRGVLVLFMFPRKDEEVALLQRYHDEDAAEPTPTNAG